MKLKKLSEAMMWLPGFAPEETEMFQTAAPAEAEIIQFPIPKKAASHKVASAAKLVWPGLSKDAISGLSGVVSKFDANVAAINLLRKLESENRKPTVEEVAILNCYTGWGGIPQAFNENQSDAAWVARAAELKSLLSEEEHKSAEASTPNAHYTSPEVIEAMWKMLQRMGFSGGRILEPAAGTGYFIGAMPKELAEQSDVTAIELDNLSARITKSLYGGYGVNVINGGFEASNLPDDFYDLAISNIPFGNYQVPELRNVPYSNFLIHDYFFAKAMDVVKPGGLIAFVTSSGTMDKHDKKVRAYLAGKANLVAAVRLPNTAFKSIANTSVTTDVIVLQKLFRGGRCENKGWINVDALPSTSPIFGESVYCRQAVNCNQHYIDNPDWVIGKLSLVSNGYSKATGCVFDGDLEAALSEKVAMVPQGIVVPAGKVAEAKEPVLLAQALVGRPGFRVVDGVVLETVDGITAAPYSATSKKALERIAGMCRVREAARKIIQCQVETEDDGLLSTYRLMLNIAYDNLVSECGYIHTRANQQAFRADPDLPLLMSLERWDAETQTAEKADIFFSRTVGRFQRVEHADTVEDAMLVSLAECGRVDESRIADLMGKPASEVMDELEGKGAVFLNPLNGEWESSDQYLSGNVREKLVAAKLSGDRYANNVQALEGVIPDDLTPEQIEARLGSTWIPSSDYDAFLNSILEFDGNKVRFNQQAGTWTVAENYKATNAVSATQKYGTSRVNALDLIDQALNQIVPTVYDQSPVDPDKRVVNQIETIAAREKQQLLKDTFREWLWSDQDRAQRLVRQYNDIFNCVVQRKYDGQHLTLPGFSRVYKLHDHQKDAIWRIASSQLNTLLAHVVGAGKTLTCICGGMELRRLGKASKPMYVVPNHMLHQFAAEFLRAYPGANILLASKDDLQGDKRRQLLTRIATGNWDGVLITHASFERIKMSDEFMSEYIQNEIAQIETAILSEDTGRRGNRIVKELARAKKAWEAKLAKLSGTNKKDDVISFEQLGIDYLFVDEAHTFKNLWRFTKMTRVAGLPNSNSERAFDMFVKTRHIMSKHADHAGVVFATGTPVSNSMAEMWTMQRFLQHKTLDAYQVGMFDTWAANFGESVTALELSPDGKGYRMHTRFAKFVNLPELISIFGEVADIRTAEMLKLPVPEAKKVTIAIKPSDDLKEFVQSLVGRAEAIKNGSVTPAEDNMLAVTGDGRKAALDMRLIDPLATVVDGKIDHCVENVFKTWEESKLFRGTQIVFCDLSTPVENGRFSVYQAIRQHLVEKGVPIQEIAFIHDFESDSAKEELFKGVREGRIRVLLGSTQKMGVGTNVQTRLIALHHIDAPWRPSDVEQREGRIIRQGNLNENVTIFRYVTEGSFDAYIWQTLETKARFIAQIMRGDTGMRSVEDVELAALSYAEVKALASGNPLVLEKAGVDSELVKLSVMKSQWEKLVWRNKRELVTLPGHVQSIRNKIVDMEADVKSRKDVTGKNFRVQVAGRNFTDRIEAGAALLEMLQSVSKSKLTNAVKVGAFAGFDIVAARKFDGVVLGLNGQCEYLASNASVTSGGCVRSIENTLASLELILQEEYEYVARTEKRLSDLTVEVTKPFEKMDRFEFLVQRQKEIDEMLDLNKNVNSSVDETEDEALAA